MAASESTKRTPKSASSGATAASKDGGKGAGKAGTTSATKSATKSATRSAAKDSTKSATKRATKSATTSAAKVPATASAKASSTPAPKASSKASSKASPTPAPKASSKASSKGSRADASAPPAKPPARDTVRAESKTKAKAPAPVAAPTVPFTPFPKKTLAHFEERLLEERKRVLKELGSHGEVFGPGADAEGAEHAAYSFHMADQGTDAMEREKAFLFAGKEGRFLHHIDQALRRLYRSPETFGRCHNCGGSVAFERLDALPHARYCIDCKQREEDAKKG